ncbi:ABC transporter permease [Demequina sp.]|uniref:ABC transporter permease n=1 Tax=Demequina sp. TaxID=2050685 RepID=UPI003D124D23
MTAVATPAPAVAAPSLQTAKHWGIPITLGVIGILSLVFFGFGTEGGTETTFAFSRPGDFFQIPIWHVPSQVTAITLSVIALGLAGYSAWCVQTARKFPWWAAVIYGTAVLFALLTWAGAGKTDTSINVTGLLTAAVVLSVPLVFGSLSGLICERSGVINIAIEGQLLAGAFTAAVVASAVGNAYVGLIAAPIAGALVGAILSLFAVKYWVNQIVVGVVLNVLVVGITNFLFSTLLRENTALNQNMPLAKLPIPLLSKIPVVGPTLFNATILVYIMYVTVAVLAVMLFRSRWGLRVRAVGEHPKAADTVGIKVNRTRVRNTILGGAVAGLGGAYFTVAAGLAFGKEMTSGAGFIALAAMILGRWRPVGALAAALLFGFANSLKDQLGIIGSSIPSQFLAMLPYLATILAVAGFVGHARPPASEGIPYKK